MQSFVMWAVFASAAVLQGRVQYPCEYEDILVLLFSSDEDSPRWLQKPFCLEEA